MSTYTITNGYDAQVDSVFVNQNLGSKVWIALSGPALDIGYVYLPFPNIAGQTIASATLTGHAYIANSATTATVKRVSGPWAEGTVTYNHQPSVVATSFTTSVPATSPGDAINIDVTTIIQTVANGAAYYGFQLTCGVSANLNFASFNSDKPSWTLTIVTTDAPEIPTKLVPNGTVVGSGAPTVTCDFVDNGGLTNDMAAMNVQVNATNVWTSPTYDHTLTTTVPVFDLSANGFTAVSSGTSRFWRVRVQDSDGNWSGWSSAATFTYRAQPTITILTPASGVLWDPTSHIIATTSANMSAYRVQITDGTDRTKIRFDSGRLAANPAALTTIDVALPEEYDGERVLADDSTYQLHILTWDTNTSRQSTTGSPSFVESWSTFHFDDDLTQTPIATLVADQPDASPAVTLTWTRASIPDAWVVHRDGKVIARLAASDVISGVSTYSWADNHPRQWVSHTYSVRALTNVSGTMKRSPTGPTVDITPGASGVWLFTQDGQSVALDDTDISQVTVNDRRTTYKPINVRYDVDDVQGFEGISGTITGVVPSGLDDSVTYSDASAVLLSIKENPGKWVRLIYGGFSGRVLLRSVSITPDARSNSAVQLARVSFGVNQVGDFDQVV